MIQRNPDSTTTGRITLGPGDHGRRMTLDEFFDAGDQVGYRYELIEGVVQVTPVPDPPHERVVMFLADLFVDYRRSHAEYANYTACRARLVQRQPQETSPEPDFCVFRDYPLHEVRPDWEAQQPIVVVEVLSPDNPGKDLQRNRRVYLGFERVQEYWIIDPLVDPTRPTMLALRRSGADWVEVPVPSGGAYTTDLLPGLTVDLSTIYPPPPNRE
ncbi:MAG: Uma2 family endonuclease [bacterium]|nr:Uma2 family endonuclease [bacterium]